MAGCVSAWILIFTSSLFGDSFLTDTEFFEAYLDVVMVKKARENQKLDTNLFQFLDDREVAFDIKLAVINALGWHYDNKPGNPQKYEKFLRSKYALTLQDSLISQLDRFSAEELTILAYLTALENYLDDEILVSLAPIIKTSVEKDPGSYGVNLVYVLISSQLMLHSRGWVNRAPELWMSLESQPDLKDQLRDEAKQMVAEYYEILIPKNE